jgi:acid phosphatase (class A)
MRAIIWAALTAAMLVTPASAHEDGESGYLAGNARIDGAQILSPPPQPDSRPQRDDEKIFLATRYLHGGDRWHIAAADDDLSPEIVAKDFSCALSFKLDNANAPHFFVLYTKVSRDARFASSNGKRKFQRPRPFVGNTAQICVERSRYEGTTSYPSGYATFIWTITRLLVDLAPDRGSQIATRGTAFVDNRVVCGVHWASDIAAGKLVADRIYAALRRNADFMADMQAAKREIVAARATAARPDEQFCKIQNAALRKLW